MRLGEEQNDNINTSSNSSCCYCNWYVLSVIYYGVFLEKLLMANNRKVISQERSIIDFRQDSKQDSSRCMVKHC